MKHELLRFIDVRKAVKLSRATIFRLERDGKFPARRQLGANSVAWVRQEIDDFIQSRPLAGNGTLTCAKPASPGRPRGSQSSKKHGVADNSDVFH